MNIMYISVIMSSLISPRNSCQESSVSVFLSIKCSWMFLSIMFYSVSFPNTGSMEKCGIVLYESS